MQSLKDYLGALRKNVNDTYLGYYSIENIHRAITNYKKINSEEICKV